MNKDFNLKEHGLRSAFCKSAGGFIFVCLGKVAPEDEFDEFLETLEAYMETL